jgi:hypothetical protein
MCQNPASAIFAPGNYDYGDKEAESLVIRRMADY